MNIILEHMEICKQENNRDYKKSRFSTNNKVSSFAIFNLTNNNIWRKCSIVLVAGLSSILLSREATRRLTNDEYMIKSSQDMGITATAF